MVEQARKTWKKKEREKERNKKKKERKGNLMMMFAFRKAMHRHQKANDVST